MFQPGTIVVIKTTGEEACVIGGSFVPTGTTGNTVETQAVYQLRVPRITRDGIHHYDASFFGFELETKLDSLRRDLESMKARADLIKEYESLAKPLATPTTRAN